MTYIYIYIYIYKRVYNSYVYMHTQAPRTQDSDLLSLGIGPEHVKRLHDELARLLELAEKGAEFFCGC